MFVNFFAFCIVIKNHEMIIIEPLLKGRVNERHKVIFLIEINNSNSQVKCFKISTLQ